MDSEVLHYEIDGDLIVNGDLEIDLDCPLEVKEGIYVAGSVKSNVPLLSELEIMVIGSIFVDGNMSARNIHAGKSIEVSEDIFSHGNILAGHYGDFSPRIFGPIPKGFRTKYNSSYDTFKKNFHIKTGFSIECDTLGCGGKIYAGLNTNDKDSFYDDEIRCKKLLNGKIMKGTLVIDKSKEIGEKKDDEVGHFAIIFILIILLICWLSGVFS